MKLLIKAAFKSRLQKILILLSVIAMCFLTMASQLEILTLGIVSKKGPDFFELFAPIKNGQLTTSDHLTKQDLDRRYDELDVGKKGYVDKRDTDVFLSNWDRNDLIGNVIAFVDKKVDIQKNITSLALFILLVAFLKAFAMFWQRFLTKMVAARVARELREEYFKHIQSLPLDFYQKYNIGSLSSRVVSDAVVIANAINSTLTNYFETPFKLVSTLILCFFTSWQLSLIIFFGFPLIVFPIIFLAKKIKKIAKQIQKNQENFASVLIDFLAGIQTVKVFAMEEFSFKKFQEQNNRMAALEQKTARYDSVSRPIIHTIGMFFLAAALLYGLYVLHMGISDVLVYCGFLYVFYEPIKKFAEENSQIQRGVAAAERMYEVISLEPNIEDHDGATSLETLKDSIVFDNVWFRYEDEWVLRGVSFTIKKGEVVAIVGPTGAGKSTIVQLLPRLYDVEEGEIQIDGKPLSAYTQRSLRENIAFVPQKPFLFLDTVRENIAFGRPFTMEEIAEAANRAHADEFIEELPMGYDTELSEAGKNLSGGQQQRLAIARALVKKAPILVMDEATSSLDALSENHIKQAISQLRGKVTQIIIAHRLSTIEDADKIIYLEKGEKVAEGTKDELLRSCIGFRMMWEMMHK